MFLISSSVEVLESVGSRAFAGAAEVGALPKLVLADAGAASRFAGSPVPGIKFRDTLGVLPWTRRTSFEENPRDPFGWTAPRAPDRGAERAAPSSNGISRYKF